MSEKRFTRVEFSNGNWGVKDNNTEYEYPSPIDLLDLLNSLHEENEQLKSDIMLIEKNADRHYEENKQLKKELNEYRQVIIDKVQYYEDNLEDFLIKKGVIKEDWARFDDYD